MGTSGSTTKAVDIRAARNTRADTRISRQERGESPSHGGLFFEDDNYFPAQTPVEFFA